MEKPGFTPKVIAGDKVDPPRGAMPVSTVHAMELPVMGRIAAGVPIEAISEVSHHVAVPGSMLSGKGQHYALEVKGDSMIEAGINDGDIVVIREQSTADNGDIVVALVEDHGLDRIGLGRLVVAARQELVALPAADFAGALTFSAARRMAS